MFDVSHIAKLARLGLAEGEEEKFTKDLGAILGFIDKLKEVDVDGVEPMAQATGLSGATRPDEGLKRGVDNRTRLLANSPENKDGYIKVRGIFE